VPTETLLQGALVHDLDVSETTDERRTLRAQAIERIHQLRRFHVHLVAFALGIPIVGGIWVLTEYYEEHTWPSRFASAPDVAGTWDPWFFWFAFVWFVVLAAHALKTYFGPTLGPLGRYIRRPVTETEVNHEIEHLQSHPGMITRLHSFSH
jgi:2TM domain